MLKKLLIVFFLSTLFIFTIYKVTKKDTYYYLAIGDALSKGKNYKNEVSNSYVDYLEEYLESKKKNVYVNKEYIYEDIRIIDLITKLNENSNLLQSVKNSSLLTISIGSEELFSKLRSYKDITGKFSELKPYLDNMINNLELLLIKIRKLNKENIFLIGYYNPLKITSENEKTIKEIYDYLDNKLKKLEKDYNVNYIEINNEFINQKYLYLPNINNNFPTESAYLYIYEQIKRKLHF